VGAVEECKVAEEEKEGIRRRENSDVGEEEDEWEGEMSGERGRCVCDEAMPLRRSVDACSPPPISPRPVTKSSIILSTWTWRITSVMRDENSSNKERHSVSRDVRRRRNV
jgi:hypothetical protein